MNKEIEVKFFIENKDEIRKKLSSLNFNLVKKEFLMKRKTFDSEVNGKWFRVRDEGDKITMTYKNIIDKTINGVNEIEILVNDFDKASEMLNQTNFKERSYQENFREVWSNQDAEIVIDTWPFLQTYIEIEALSEDIVKYYTEKLGFNFEKDAYFGSVDVLYVNKYGISKEDFCRIENITFNNNELKSKLENKIN